jgi:hypothetical protein
MLFLTKSWIVVYEDEGGAGDGDGGAGDGNAGAGTGKPKLTDLIEKHGLQEELNTMMANNRKTLHTKNQELIQQLTQLRETATMSTQAKEELEARIEELQTQHMSKEELAKRESEKLTKTHARELEKITGESKKWQELFATSTIQRALMDAAVAGDALTPAVAQIGAILGPHTHIVEEVDEAGNGKGKFKTVVKFEDTDADGNPVVLDLSPAKTIERMKELPEKYGFLFKGENSSGLGAETAGGSRSEKMPKLDELIKDPAKFAKWRKENPDLDISKLRR